MGVLFALLAALLWGASSLLVRRSLEGLRATTTTFISLVAGTFLAFGVALTVHRGQDMAVPLGVVGWVVLTGVLQYPLGRLLNFAGVGLAGVNRATAVVGMAPLFATLFAVLLGGEQLTPPLLVGTVLVVAGVFFLVSAR